MIMLLRYCEVESYRFWILIFIEVIVILIRILFEIISCCQVWMLSLWFIKSCLEPGFIDVSCKNPGKKTIPILYLKIYTIYTHYI